MNVPFASPFFQLSSIFHDVQNAYECHQNNNWVKDKKTQAQSCTNLSVKQEVARDSVAQKKT